MPLAWPMKPRNKKDYMSEIDKFDLAQWRKDVGDKVGKEVTQEAACKLLGFEDATSISKIERGVEKVHKRTVLLATAIIGMPAARIKDRLRSPFKTK